MPLPTAPPLGALIRTLRGLSSYACGHTGSCCRAGWPIPVETAPLDLLRRADADGTLPRLGTTPWMQADILGQTTNKACVFHAPGAVTGGCAVESTLGSHALPYSCRQFPRLLLVDMRGWHMSLSAWCGTAARMIVEDSLPARNSSTPSCFLRAGDASDFLSFNHISSDQRVHLEGLDAREAWPPLLRPGVLAGHGAYAKWEARLLTDFVGPACAGRAPLPSMLASALCWTDALRGWHQSDGSLDVLAGRPWRHPDPNRVLRFSAAPDGLRSRLLLPLLAGVPGEWRPATWPVGLTDVSMDGEPVSRRQADAAIGRYLATRLVGSWVAYQGKGLRSVMASLVSAYVLTSLALRATGRDSSTIVTLGRLTSAIRSADWLLLHLLDRDVWARTCSECEVDPDAAPLLQLVAGAAQVLDAQNWAASPD